MVKRLGQARASLEAATGGVVSDRSRQYSLWVGEVTKATKNFAAKWNKVLDS